MKATKIMAITVMLLMTLTCLAQVASSNVAADDGNAGDTPGEAQTSQLYWSKPIVKTYNGTTFTYSTSFRSDIHPGNDVYTKADMKFLDIKIAKGDYSNDYEVAEWNNLFNVLALSVHDNFDVDLKRDADKIIDIASDDYYKDRFPGVTNLYGQVVPFDVVFTDGTSAMLVPNLLADFVMMKINIGTPEFAKENSITTTPIVFNWNDRCVADDNVQFSWNLFNGNDYTDLNDSRYFTKGNGIDDDNKQFEPSTYDDAWVTATDDNPVYYGTYENISWTIEPKSITDDTISIEIAEVVYDRQLHAITEAVTVIDSEKANSEKQEFKGDGIVDMVNDGYIFTDSSILEGTLPTEGNLYFEIEGFNYYKDETANGTYWSISKIDLSYCDVTCSSLTFNDLEQSPSITITATTAAGTTITGVKDSTPEKINKGGRFFISGEIAARDAGDYNITIEAPSSSAFFKGTTDATWNIAPADIKDHFNVYLDYHQIYSYKTQSIGVYFKTYDTKAPVLTVECFFDDQREAQVSEDKDYTVEGLTANAGENEITVTGIGNYTGKIEPIPVIIDPLDITGKQVTVNDVYTDLNGQFSYDDLKGNVFIRIGLVPQYGDYDVIAEDGWGVKKEFPASTESTLNYVTVYGTGNLIGVTEGTFNVYPGDQLVQDGVIYKVISEEEKTIGVIGYDAETITEDVEIPYVINGYTVTTIASKAFYGCLTMKTLDLGDVTSIGTKAFTNCKNVTTVVLSDSLKTISAYAFYNCRNLESIDIPDSVKTIGSYAFYKCGALKSIDFGSSITKIGSQAFASVTFVDGETTLKATPKNLAGHSFEGSNKVLKLVA